MKRVEQLLRQIIGLDAASIGTASLRRAVRQRMRIRKAKTMEDYERLLIMSQDERTELIELVVVTESWFFRDREAFDAMVRLVVTEWLPAHETGVLRLLSLPCASGEEPYSMAIALLDAGVPPGRFHITAFDISAHALARATTGIYTKNSFRGSDDGIRDRYFSPAPASFLIHPQVHACVTFRQANIVAADFPPDDAPYDFIFCRNLLIYFDAATQRRALANIGRCLAPSGVLFVGPAEQPLAFAGGFISAGFPRTFACRKADAAVHSHHPVKLCEPFTSSLPSQVFSQPGPPLPSEPQEPRSGEQPLNGATGDLAHARRLADTGRLAEAAAICESHLHQNHASAHAYYLLGLVRDAGGDSRSVECYRKALYLKPDHYEALLQMALLAQKNGEHDAARAFKRRAERLKIQS